ncbi:MAG TPA: ABC transporter ATP-binding protein [Blastocatellia bacterium]|nr:ABC transporter ATP-binding protein [Blastocatellia bacterium]
MLEVRNLSFSYERPVLNDVSFSLGSGELLAVLGPNGSGKSTLLKLIAGIETPGAGVVSMEGRDVSSLSRREAARAIGYVAQESIVRFPLSVLEFVLQGRFAHGRLLGFESEEDERETIRALELTETVEFAERKITELSGGERQRVMIARAIASRPRLLVLDEPVANLDIAHQVKVFQLVKSLVADEAMTAVVVTHELNLAAEFASLAMLLKQGSLVAFASTAEVMHEDLLRSVFEAELHVDRNPITGAPRITPLIQSAPISARS